MVKKIILSTNLSIQWRKVLIFSFKVNGWPQCLGLPRPRRERDCPPLPTEIADDLAEGSPVWENKSSLQKLIQNTVAYIKENRAHHNKYPNKTKSDAKT